MTVNNIIWKQNTLKLNILVKMDDFQISDLDMSFKVIKYGDSQANMCELSIWNLNKTTFQRFAENVSPVEICASYGEDVPSLVFKGHLVYIKEDAVTQNKNSSEIIPDLKTVMKLMDGKVAYTERIINKNYREAVSSTQIIKDCIVAMGLGTSKFTDKLPEKIYDTYKAYGPPQVALEKITKPLGIIFSVQNEMVDIISPNDVPKDQFAVLLNPSNSKRPLIENNRMSICTRLIPFLNPNDYVKCEFEEYTGVAKIHKLTLTASNHEDGNESEIVIVHQSPQNL